MPLTMIILAAGMGSRFGGPKQLVPVGPAGESILDYNAHDAVAAGFDRLVVVTRAELVADVSARLERGSTRVSTNIVLQEIPAGRAKPLGTAEAVTLGSSFVDGPFAVANSDDLYGASAFHLLADHLRQIEGAHDAEAGGAVVAYRLSDTVPTGTGAVSRAVLSSAVEGELAALVEVLRSSR